MRGENADREGKGVIWRPERNYGTSSGQGSLHIKLWVANLMTTRCSFRFVRNPSLLIHSFQEENLVATIARKLLHRCRTGNEVDLQAPRESLSEAVKLLVERGSIRRGRGIEIPVGALTGSGAGLYARNRKSFRGIAPAATVPRKRSQK